MSTLNQAALDAAYRAFVAHPGASRPSVEAAIEAYLAEVFKPGELIVGGAIEPQRDYRKELWADVAIAVARSDSATSKYAPGDFADTTLAKFDAQFGDAK